MQNDLALSGLEPQDLRTRPLEMTERAACGIPPNVEGYVIPYFNISGRVLPFYRCKLFNHDIKYKQLKSTSNHVYFPPQFQETLAKSRTNYVILTEGEKKAAAACKAGFPAIAFGGVDSWRNRILLLPKDVELSAYSYNKQLVGAKLPSSAWDTQGVVIEPIAVGFEDLANFLRDRQMHAVIIYDSDETTTISGMKPEVQKAASELGFELRRRGIPINHIRQLILPNIEGVDKTGLDDFLNLLDDGKKRLEELVTATMKKRSAFPQHPNMEAEMNKKLQNSKLSRKDVQRLSLSLITDLDGRGIRMYSQEEDQLYYFEEKGNKLIKVDLDTSNNKIAGTPFAKLMYHYYGISMTNDARLIKWLAAQFSAESPVEDVRPFRVLAREKGDDYVLRYQISDGQYVKITSDPKNPIEILHNGAENVLFESGQVEPIDADELLKEFKKRQTEELHMWWEDVLHEVRLKNHGKNAALFSLLYYISPWLHRWRGTQLPAELVIGEAGSGKSTLCELRLSILTGQPNLRNAPNDMKDWHTSIVNTGGLHVTDNVQLHDKNLKQRLSDEICRLITEPEPHIEMRKYYTNADLMRMKVDAVFCFTAILQPFNNSDVLQRSMILELDKMANDSSTQKEAKVSYDSGWKDKQIARFGGRTAWIAHHLYVLHRFLQLASTKWDHNYKAKHRLINLEQSLMLVADLFGLEAKWIPDFLSSQIDEMVVDSDWSLEGVVAFCETVRAFEGDQAKLAAFAQTLGGDARLAKQMKFDAKTIAAWAASHEQYMECQNLVNSRKLGRYLQTHKAMVAQVVQLMESDRVNNKTTYHVRPDFKKPKA